MSTVFVYEQLLFIYISIFPLWVSLVQLDLFSRLQKVFQETKSLRCYEMMLQMG